MSEKSSSKHLSFEDESYERVNQYFGHRSSYRSLPDAKTPPLSLRKICLPNEDGEYRPYKETTEIEVYIHNTGTYYYLGAAVCPKVLKCSECPLR